MKIEATPKEIADLIDELKKPAKISDYVRDKCHRDREGSIMNPLTENKGT